MSFACEHDVRSTAQGPLGGTRAPIGFNCADQTPDPGMKSCECGTSNSAIEQHRPSVALGSVQYNTAHGRRCGHPPVARRHATGRPPLVRAAAALDPPAGAATGSSVDGPGGARRRPLARGGAGGAADAADPPAVPPPPPTPAHRRRVGRLGGGRSRPPPSLPRPRCAPQVG